MGHRGPKLNKHKWRITACPALAIMVAIAFFTVKKTSSLCWLPLVLSLALLVRIATRVTLVEASRVSVGLLLAHVRCMLNKHLLEC